jgi:hypothetical protein
VKGLEPGHVTSKVRPFFGAASALVTPSSVTAPESPTTVATARFLIARLLGSCVVIVIKAPMAF